MYLGRWSLLIRSLRHTRLKQLLHRLRLQARRRLRRAGRGRETDAMVASVRPDLPRGAPCDGPLLVEARGGGRFLRLLNHEVPLRLPMDWGVPDIGIGRPLAELEVHYLDWLRGLGDEDFLLFSEDWLDQNLCPKGRWWNTSWNCYGLAIRTVVWMQEIAERFARLPAGRRQRLCNEVAFQIRFLEQNLELDLGGNHLLKDLVALLWAGRFFVGAEAERWTALGSSLLARELDEQMLPDGLHYERSPAYHALVLLDLLDCYRVLGPGQLRERLQRVLRRGAQALVDLTHPDGGISLFNDGGLSKAPASSAILEAIAAATGSAVKAGDVFALPDAGYFGWRNGKDLFLADCGPIAPDHLPAHGHGDILSFEWSVDGKRIVTDFGVYEYTVGVWREASRATSSHNTVTVEGADQCEFWSSFRVGRRARITRCDFRPAVGGFELVGEHNGYAHLPGRPMHERKFVVGADAIEIEDRVRGGRGQVVQARLLLHPDCEVTLSPGRARIEHSGTVALVDYEAEARLTPSWWCPDFGKKIATQQLVLEYGAAPCRGGFRLRKAMATASGSPSQTD